MAQRSQASASNWQDLRKLQGYRPTYTQERDYELINIRDEPRALEAVVRLFEKIRYLIVVHTRKSVKNMYIEPGETHAQKRSAKTLSLYTRLVSERLQLYRPRLQTLEKMLFFFQMPNLKKKSRYA